MSTREEASFRQTCLWLAIGACFLLAGYLSFVSVLSILVSAAFFFKDITLTLKAIKLEAREYLEGTKARRK